MRTTDLKDNLLIVSSDVQVNDGKTLTIESGITVKADQQDEANLGINSDENEIILVGRLVATGVAGSKIVFRSTAANPVAGDWGGFYIKNGGDLRLTYADVSHAIYGVFGVALADTIALTNTDIDSCQQMVISVNNRCSLTGQLPETCTSTRLFVNGGSITTNTATHGIFTYFPLEVSVDGTLFNGGTPAFYGILVDSMNSGTIDPIIRNCTFTNFEAGTAICSKYNSPTLRGNNFKNCKWGVQLQGPHSPRVEYDATLGRGNHMAGCTTGLLVGRGSPVVDSLSIASCATGIYSDGTSTGTYSRVNISGGTIGFQVFSTGTCTLRQSKIVDFTTNGVKYNRLPPFGLDLGTTAVPGNNWIYAASAPKYVAVKSCSTGTVKAEQNYWGAGSPDSNKFAICVDFAPYLSSPPAPTRPLVSESRVGRVVLRPFAAVPNPFSGTLTFSFGIGGTSVQPVSLRLYSITGRLVRTLLSEHLSPGDYHFEWDGRDDRGVKTSAGIYFVRFGLGQELITRKLVKVQQ